MLPARTQHPPGFQTRKRWHVGAAPLAKITSFSRGGVRSAKQESAPAVAAPEDFRISRLRGGASVLLVIFFRGVLVVVGPVGITRPLGPPVSPRGPPAAPATSPTTDTDNETRLLTYDNRWSRFPPFSWKLRCFITCYRRHLFILFLRNTRW